MPKDFTGPRNSSIEMACGTGYGMSYTGSTKLFTFLTGEQLNPQDRRLTQYYSSLPSWQGREATLCRVFTPHSTLHKVLCKSHKHQCRQCRQT